MISFNMLMDTLFTKTSFFHNFQKKQHNFFTIFKRKDAIFSQLVWYRTPSQFWKKRCQYQYLSVLINRDHRVSALGIHISRVFPDAQICAFWRMFSTNDPQNELTLRHTGRTQCLSKWINPQPYFIVSFNIYLCQLVKLLQKAFKYQFASVRQSIL